MSASPDNQWYQFEEQCGAALRAVSGFDDVYYRGSRLYRNTQFIAVHAPHLKPQQATHHIEDYRGFADGNALRLKYSDHELHQKLCPAEERERLIFELLEQLRVETLVPDHLPGMRANLKQRFIQWSLESHHQGLTESGIGLLFYTIAQMSWARLNGYPVVEETEDYIEATRAGIAPILGRALAAMKRCRDDQQAFAEHALSIAQEFSSLIETATGDDVLNENDDNQKNARYLLMLSFDDEDAGNIALMTYGDARDVLEGRQHYNVFTKEYDQVIEAHSLVRNDLLKEYRLHLDELIKREHINVPRLVRELAPLFMHPERDGWDFDKPQGYIDARRLSRVLTSPEEQRIFKYENHHDRADSAVTFLIDCSGSMKAHSESIAMLVDVFCRALEQLHVPSEVLGFTTGGWNGGRAMKDWYAKGRPENPGRLNEINHLIFKQADESWHKARQTIVAMLKHDLYREGVDGEAVEWAAGRLKQRQEQRRVLIVISDGCPMESATSLANTEHYLDRHLQSVVAEIETTKDIEVYGLGVGLDLSPYYRYCDAIDLTQGLSHRVFHQVIRLLEPH